MALLGGRGDGCVDWKGKMGSSYPGRGNSMDKDMGVGRHRVSGTQGYAYGRRFSLVRSPDVEVKSRGECRGRGGHSLSWCKLFICPSVSPPPQLYEFFHIHLPLQDTFHTSPVWLRCLPVYSRGLRGFTSVLSLSSVLPCPVLILCVYVLVSFTRP